MSGDSDDPDTEAGDTGSAGSVESSSDAPDESGDAGDEPVRIGDDGSGDEAGSGGLRKLDTDDPQSAGDADEYGPPRPPEGGSGVRFSDGDDTGDRNDNEESPENPADGSDDDDGTVGFGADGDEASGLEKLEGGDPEPAGDGDREEYGPHRPSEGLKTRPERRNEDDGDDAPPPGHGAGATPPSEFDDDAPENTVEPVTATDGASPTGAGTGTGTGFPPEGGPGDPLVDEEPPQPPDDEEMPLTEHIEEMVKRLAVVVAAVAVATGLAFPFAEPVLDAMWYGLLPPDTPAPHLYGPLEKILAEIKVASLAGILVALPVLVYEAYLFMRPGLYPKERRYFLSSVPISLVLGAIGMAFAYFVVLPVLFDYFVFYSKSGVDKLAFGLRVTFDLIVALLGAFALVFQIPLLIMLAILMGVTSRRWLESRRLYFWGGFLGLGFLMGGADLTGMAPIIIAATMIGLFEGTLALLRWTQR